MIATLREQISKFPISQPFFPFLLGGFIIGPVFFISVFLGISVDLAPAQKPTEKITHVKQGEAFLLELDIKGEIESPYIQFGDTRIPVFKLPETQSYGALIGIDMAKKPAQYNLEFKGGKESRIIKIDVTPVEFGVQELTLPKDKVDLDATTLKRVQIEKEEILKSMKPRTKEKLWEGEFIFPVEGEISGRFGVRRILNGQPRSPHSGEDFSAPEGTDVKATNTGRVVLIGDFFFTGKSVIIDHGLGCFSMYFHLHQIEVKTGDLVPKGNVIGTVGSTGRATGPHLHWGVRILGERVNPLSLVGSEIMTISGLR